MSLAEEGPPDREANSRAGRAFSATWIGLAALLAITYASWNPPIAIALGRLLPLATGLGVIAAYAGWGTLLSRWVAPGAGPRLDAATSLALGLGMTALFITGIGAVGWLTPLIQGVWIGLGALLALLAAPGLRGVLPPGLPSGPWGILGAASLAVSVTIAIPFLTAPEASLDALAYHLLVAKRFLEAGRTFHLPGFVESNYPRLAPYVYAPALALFGEETCRAMHFLTTLALLAVMADLGRTLAPAASGALAPALFVAMPIVLIHATCAWNDMFFTFFMVLCVRHLVAALTESPPGPRHLLPAGLMLGLATQTKYTFVLYLLPLALILARALRRRLVGAKDLGWFCGGTLALALPWMIENALRAGNPFYPFLHRLFPSPEWPEHVAALFLHSVQRWELADWTAWSYLTWPARITLRPRLIDIHTGVVPLLMIPLLALRLRAPAAWITRTFLVGGALSWMAIRSENRSLLALLAILLIHGAAALQEAPWLVGRLRSLAVVALAAAAALGLPITMLWIYGIHEPMSYFVGREDRDTYLARNAPSHETYRLIDRSPGARKVLLVGLHEPYYLRTPCLFSAYVDIPIVETVSRGARSATELAERFHALGITHVAVKPEALDADLASGLGLWSSVEREAFDAFLRDQCRVLGRPGGDVVYEITRPLGPPA